MNLALIDPFTLQQEYPENATYDLRSGHCSTIRFNRKGDYLAAGRTDGIVVIFDVETSGVACKLRGHTRQVQSLSWSKQGRHLLSAAQDWKCLLWDLQDGSVVREVRFNGPIYIAELHPFNHLNFVVALFDDQPMIVDISEPKTIKLPLTSAPKRRQIDEDDQPTEKQAAQDAKQTTTVACFTASGDHIIAGTNKGWLNIIEVSSRTVIYSNKLSAGVIVLLRLTSSGRDLVVNSSDRVIRVITLPNLSVENLDPDTIDIEVEHRIADVVNRLSWNHATFSSTGEYITATTYNNHDIYVWERGGGTLVKLLEGVREEHGVVEWHPQRPLIAACGLETGRVHVWSLIPEQRWSALAPDFVEVEENVDYVEREDEFDIHPKEELQKRQLDLEDEDIDLWTIAPLQGQIGNNVEDNDFIIPVDYNYVESESEEELIPVGRGEMRRKDPGDGRDYTLDGDADNEGEGTRKKKKGRKH